MTGKPLFGDRIAAKTGAAAAGEPARQAKYISPLFWPFWLRVTAAPRSDDSYMEGHSHGGVRTINGFHMYHRRRKENLT